MPSIDDEDQSLDSITRGDRALELFTDRCDLTRLFLDRLNEDPPLQQILFVHGAGGNGKSLLLKYLRQQCTKRLLPEIWMQIKERSNHQISEYISQLVGGNYHSVPSALLDFGAKPIGVDLPQNRFYGLLTLRRNLAESVSSESPQSSFRFPLYDFACIWYLHKKGKSPEEIKAMFPVGEISGLIAPLIDLVLKNPVGAISQALLSFVSKNLGEQFSIYMAQIKLSTEEVERICGKDLDTELIDILPSLFAQDLNAAMTQDTSPKRVVLFFDTHEAFWGHQRNVANSVYFFRDEWLRRFLRGLDFATGIVVVIAGRDQPRWPEAKKVNEKTEVPKEFIQLVPVGHFSEQDADVYLQKVGIEDTLLRQSLLKYARVQPEEIHPLYLGLGADVVLQAQAKEIFLSAEDFPYLPEACDQGKVLIELLLRYVNPDIRDAIQCLSACRAFDYELYIQLGKALNFTPNYANFELLTSFSFIWEAPQISQNSYRIHDLLRRLSYEGGDKRGRSTHKFLSGYYRSQADIAEAIYHTNRLYPLKGVTEWYLEFEKALQTSQYEQCEALIKIRKELISLDPSKNGLLSNYEGKYFAVLARYVEAKQAYLDSMNFYESALEESPENFYVISNKGYTLQCMGNLYVDLADYENAEIIYEKSIMNIESLLKNKLDKEDEVFILSNQGDTFQYLGKLQKRLSKYTEARKSYDKSLEAYDNAISKYPEDIKALNSKGLTLQQLGNLCEDIERNQEAEYLYLESIGVYDILLNKLDNLHKSLILNNKGIVLKDLGTLQKRLSKYTEARKNYDKSLEAYDDALGQAPDSIIFLSNKGDLLRHVGDLLREIAQLKNAQESSKLFEDALNNYQKSIDVLNIILGMAPSHIGTLNKKGYSLQRLGDLFNWLGYSPNALATYQKSIDVFTETLLYAPKFIEALRNKGMVLASLGKLQVDLSNDEEASKNLKSSFETLSLLLQLIQDNDYILALLNKIQELLDDLN